MEYLKERKYLTIYYVVLLLILAVRQSATTDPPMFFRLIFMAVVFAPTFFSKEVFYPAVLTLFYTISTEGFGYSYMPYTLSLYAVVTVVVAVFWRRSEERERIPNFLLLFLLYIFVVDGVHLQIDSSVALSYYCFVIVIFFIMMTEGCRLKGVVEQFSLCFSVITIFLGLSLLLFKDSFVMEYQDTGFERSGWTDPNYFGMIVGMGAVCGWIKVFDAGWRELDFWVKVVYLAAVVVSVPVLLLNASRGAVLSLGVSFVILMFFSKTKSSYKVLTIAAVAAGLLYLYTNSYFDLLEYRVNNDDGTGSDRTVIWEMKLAAYAEGNVFQKVFGVGHYGGSNITGGPVGFHNDYIGFLVDYGVVGVLFYLYYLIYPIITLRDRSIRNIGVYVLVIYMAMCSVTLEPILTGFFAFYAFNLYALFLARRANANTL